MATAARGTRDGDDAGARLAEDPPGPLEVLGHLGVESRGLGFLEKADPQARHPAPERPFGIADGLGRGRGIERIDTGNDAVETRRVGDAPRQRPDLVERRGERDEAVAGDAPVGRLEADHAAARRRLPDRAPRVRAESGRDEPGRDRRGASARRAPRDARNVPGVPRHVGGAVLGRGAHRELVHVGPPDEDRSGAPAGARPPWSRRAGETPRGSARRRSFAGRPPRCCPSWREARPRAEDPRRPRPSDRPPGPRPGPSRR